MGGSLSDRNAREGDEIIEGIVGQYGVSGRDEFISERDEYTHG